VRGFVMATVTRAPFAGEWTTLVNENFANMADVHRILETLPDGADLIATADGRDKTIAASRARLARMVGSDVSHGTDAQWRGAAPGVAEAQPRATGDGALLALSQTRPPTRAPIVGAGIGTAWVAEIARRLGREYIAFGALIDAAPAVGERAGWCAPAASVA